MKINGGMQLSDGDFLEQSLCALKYDNKSSFISFSSRFDLNFLEQKHNAFSFASLELIKNQRVFLLFIDHISSARTYVLTMPKL